MSKLLTDEIQVYIEALNQDLRHTSRRIQSMDQELLKRIEEIQTKLMEGGQLKLQRLAIPATQVMQKGLYQMLFAFLTQSLTTPNRSILFLSNWPKLGGACKMKL